MELTVSHSHTFMFLITQSPRSLFRRNSGLEESESGVLAAVFHSPCPKGYGRTASTLSEPMGDLIDPD